MYEDMPTPGTRQWGQWFNQQDPDAQQQIIFDFGLSDANTPVAGSNAGTMLPEISGQGFGMLDQMAPPPVINSKGVIQPSGTEQKQKQLNLFQDENSLMTDNVLAAIAGQYAPTAFTPTYEGQGNPVTQNGLRQLMSLSQGGGWEGFMANQMLPEQYGGGGMTSSQAKAALMKVVMQPESEAVTQEARDLRDELLNSIPLRYETTGGKPGDTPVNKDLTTAQGIANTFDFSGIDQESRDWQKALATDPIAGYTDPKTGLSYVDAKEIKTPTMEWFDKYGLPYANKSYADPDQIAGFQDTVAPWQYQGQGEVEDQARQAALAANAAARGELGDASSQFDILQRAYDQATKAGIGQDRQVPKQVDPMLGTTNAPASMSGASLNPGGLYAAPGNYSVMAQQAQDRATQPPEMETIPGKFYMDLDPTGKLLGLSLDQTQPSGQTWSTKNETKDGVTTTRTIPGVEMGAGLTADTNFDFGKPGAIVPGKDFGATEQLIPGLEMLTRDRKVMTAADLGTAKQRRELASKAAAKTVAGIQAASNSSETSMQRQLARARMMGLASTGRTPLSDTLAGRMMAARTAGVYG